MRKTMLMSAAVGIAVLSAGATASYLAWKDPDYAEVVSVRPITHMVLVRDIACQQGLGRRPSPASDEDPVEGIVIDGMAGGMVAQPPENETPETVAADAATIHGGAGAATTARRCSASNRVAQKIVAYVVHYRFRGQTVKVRMDHDPGPTLPVRDGKVVL